VLSEISANDIPAILVFNKIDLTDLKAQIKTQENGLVTRVWLSAQTGEGVDLLLGAIEKHMMQAHSRYMLELPPSQSKLRSVLYNRHLVKNEQIDDAGVSKLELELSPADVGWLKKQSNANIYELK